MALVQNTLIGKATGSVGNVTFAGWKGKQVMKSKSTNNYSDPTQEQLNNNSKFATMVAFARSILFYISLGFKAGAVGKSEYNVFTQENPYSSTVTGSPGAYKVDTENIIVSKGPEFQEGMPTLLKSADGANDINIEWMSNDFSRSTDLLYVLAFNRISGQFIVANSATVAAEGLILTAPGIGTNIATTDVYAFYVNGNNGKACDSIIVPTA